MSALRAGAAQPVAEVRRISTRWIVSMYVVRRSFAHLCRDIGNAFAREGAHEALCQFVNSSIRV